MKPLAIDTAVDRMVEILFQMIWKFLEYVFRKKNFIDCKRSFAGMPKIINPFTIELMPSKAALAPWIIQKFQSQSLPVHDQIVVIRPMHRSVLS